MTMPYLATVTAAMITGKSGRDTPYSYHQLSEDGNDFHSNSAAICELDYFCNDAHLHRNWPILPQMCVYIYIYILPHLDMCK